jgi:hypothetical protein
MGRMDAARRARRVAIAVLVCACASTPKPPADRCVATAERPPRPTVACFESDEGQRYAGRVASLIAETLSGYHSHPGKAELSVGFDAEASVASVCADPVDGDRVAQRLPGAIAELRELPAAPACFANRRLDFAWESPEVTAEHVRVATRECRREIEGHRRRNLFCLEMQRCSEREVIERWDRGDRELRACVLGKIPLEMRVAESAEAHHFVPIAASSPDPDRAIEALEVCDALADREALVGCMREHGWVPR